MPTPGAIDCVCASVRGYPSTVTRIDRIASGASLDWEVLAQCAQGTRDMELLELAKQRHPDTLRQMRWTNGMVKELSAQILVTP